MKLKDVATIKTNMEGADFWVIRRGSIETVGSVVHEFYREHIGIRVFRTDILMPEYLFFAMMNLHTQGIFKNIARGTLTLVHISVWDIKNIELSPI
jgi:hypothetical protein